MSNRIFFKEIALIMRHDEETQGRAEMERESRLFSNDYDCERLFWDKHYQETST
jgi:hypothetical protein